jgi:hypothetical protein
LHRLELSFLAVREVDWGFDKSTFPGEMFQSDAEGAEIFFSLFTTLFRSAIRSPPHRLLQLYKIVTPL